VRDSRVARPRLRAQLDRGLHEGERLILVSAPAGYGKTTVLAEWLASERIPAAWLSLDEQDEDSKRFWIYVIAALQSIAPDFGNKSFNLPSAPTPVHTILASRSAERGREPLGSGRSHSGRLPRHFERKYPRLNSLRFGVSALIPASGAIHLLCVLFYQWGKYGATVECNVTLTYSLSTC
jgi:hypothetical protein